MKPRHLCLLKQRRDCLLLALFLMELLQGGARLLLKRANGARYIEQMVAHGFFQ